MSHEKYQRLIDATRGFPPVPTAVAHPCDETTLTGAVDAAKRGLIRPFLVGPRAKIAAVAEKFGLDISPYDLVDAPHSHAAARRAVELAREGSVKGRHPDFLDLLHAIPVQPRDAAAAEQRRDALAA